MSEKKRILIVDDEAVLVDLMRTKLTQHGFDIVVAHDGEEGLQKALEARPDLILMDIVMPRMDGITVVKKLRQDPWGKTVPVIILTNLNTAETVENSIASGVYDYLVKIDYTLDDLVGIISKRLGLAGEGSERIMPIRNDPPPPKFEE
ncbi:MAG: response regulator [Candidatus Pacebacteria bacterium]|jgi:CheY-like chemotaxis protein|nr:response regulator [Candidatus Paceibacterota bacterium]